MEGYGFFISGGFGIETTYLIGRNENEKLKEFVNSRWYSLHLNEDCYIHLDACSQQTW